MSIVRLTFNGSENPITPEVNDALNLLAMYQLVEEGSMTQEEYDRRVAKFEKKYNYPRK